MAPGKFHGNFIFPDINFADIEMNLGMLVYNNKLQIKIDEVFFVDQYLTELWPMNFLNFIVFSIFQNIFNTFLDFLLISCMQASRDGIQIKKILLLLLTNILHSYSPWT
jgi:hypothetical protein